MGNQHGLRILYIGSNVLESTQANMIQILHMCHAFSCLGHHVTFALPGNSCTSEHLRRIAENRLGKGIAFNIVRYPAYRIANRMGMIGGMLGVRELLRKTEADICYIRNPAFLFLLVRHNMPTIYEAHDAVVHANPVWNRVWTNSVSRDARHLSMKKFIAISQRLREHWVGLGVPREKTAVFHDAVDVGMFSGEGCRRTLRTELGLPLDKKLVVYAGSLYRNRGIEKILSLAGSFRDVAFVILGGPRDGYLYYQALAAERGLSNAIFIGHVDHSKVPRYLLSADVLLMVWTRQIRTIDFCSPLKMFEYMAAGRTIVGDGFPTIHEVLTHGRDALLSDPDSFDDLRENLARALRMSHPNPIGEAAHKLASARFSWEARARGVLSSLQTSN